MRIFKSVRFWVIFVCAALAATALGLGLGLGLKKPGRRGEVEEKDIQRPVVTIEHVGDLAEGATAKIEFSATDDVGVTRVEIVVTNDAGEDVTGEVYDEVSKTFTATGAGKYTVTIKAYDEAGNLGSAMHTITVKAPSDDSEPDPKPEPTPDPKPEPTPDPKPEPTPDPKPDPEPDPKPKPEPEPDPEPEPEPEPEPDPEDTTAPTVVFNGENTVIAGDVLELPFTATDNVAVVRVEIKITNGAGEDVTDGVYSDEDGTFTTEETGEYTVVVKAYDKAGNCGRAELVVTVTARQTESVSDYELPQDPNFGAGVSVHDPSVYYDEVTQKYYVFGSHFAVASSTDLMHWQQLVSDGQAQKLYGTSQFRTVLSKSNQIVGGDQNTWAPDVQKIGDKYYMYYSLTSGFGSNKSVIGRVSSDSVTGPYSNEEIIVWSEGLSGNPNCIDPELFYDKTGKLWMVYGSFFAGIYIKELNAQGLPVQSGEHDYGKLLWKGGSTGAEGPFVFYSEETDYYYLMVSDGSLSTDYNMRVARSKNPDGPYTDGAGRDMSVAYGGGNKLAGNYQFAGDSVGYAAMGHNSVVKANGKCFVVYHTRYRDGEGNGVTGWHNVQVNQLFFNADGWVVMSPNRYAGESLGKVVGSDFAGKYDVVLHSVGNEQTFVSSICYEFLSGGTITKKSTTVGSWAVVGDYGVEITLNSVTYKGVITPAWIAYKGAALSFTAMSAEGRSLWGNYTESDSDIAPSGVTALQTIEGDASNRRMDAFDTSKGFAVSFYLSEAIAERNAGANITNDWNSATVTAGAYAIHLPNLDAYTSSGELAGMNRYPLENLSVWNTFLNTTCYITISVSKTGGIVYYKNGIKVLNYDPNYAMHKNDGDTWTSSVGKFIELLLAEIEHNGFTFAGGIRARDLILSEAVTDDQAAALYQDYSE